MIPIAGNWQYAQFENLEDVKMRKSGLGFAMILAILLLVSTGIIFSLSSTFPQMLNGIGMTVSAIFLAFVIGMDLLFIILIARTPNRWWEP
jgi:ABC-type amino acid transport system permease subunit